MKRTSTNGTGVVNGHTHVGTTFAKVLDGRKQPIRGLWLRGERFYAQLTVENPVDGTKSVKRIPLEAVTQAQAVAAMESLKVKRAANDLPTIRRTPKFADFVVTYLEALRAGEGRQKASTIEKTEGALANWVTHIGQLRLDQIKPAHISSFKTQRSKAGIGNRTVNLDVIAIRCCLKKAREEGWLQRLPTEGMTPLPTRTKKKSLTPLSVIETICAAAFAKTHDGSPVTKNAQQFADYVRLLAYCGARRNEALALRWDDVDFDKGQLTIGSDGDTKNSESRQVELNPKLKAHLQDMHQRASHKGHLVSDFLFPSPQRGERDASTKTFKESLNLARTHANLPGFNFHDCRHTFISMCVMARIDYMTIAGWVGHKDGGVLIGKVYGHLANEHKQAMAAKLDFEPTIVKEQKQHDL